MRFVSWNIHGGVGTDGLRSLSRIAEVLAACGCDVAGLQEVGDPHSGSGDHASWLAQRLGFYLAYGPNLVLAGRPYGNAILSRFPISNARNYDLSVEGREPRDCLRADLQLPGGRSLHFFDLHLGLSFGERYKQAARLLSAELLRDTALTAPLVLCGDFNLWSPLPGPIVRILKASLRDAAQELRRRKATWPSRRPLIRLDRTYVDAAVSLLGCGVVNDRRARTASDHLPLWVDLEPKGVAPGLAAGKAGA
jgi:endonuclease/exonuclease/phosphatase family metal-dependent hydrolase